MHRTVVALQPETGKELWKFDAGTGIMGPPVTYTADGIQYVTVLAGWGGPNAQYNTPKWGNVKFGYGGRIFNVSPELQKHMPGTFLGHDARELVENVNAMMSRPATSA